MNDDVRALARLLPDPARHELPSGRLDLLRERFMHQIATDPTAESVPPTPASSPTPASPPSPRTPARRRRLVPALVGAAMAFVVAVWLTSAVAFGVGKFWAGRTEAGDLLHRIALVAANSTDIPPLDQIRDDQFVYVETYGDWGGWDIADGSGQATWSAAQPHRRQLWLSVDGSRAGLLREEGGREEALDPVTEPGLHAPTLRYLASMPADPDLLLLRIYWENGTMGPTPQQEAFVTIGDLIRASIVPPDLAPVLYQAAARIPGIEVVDDVRDALGRPGVAIARTHDGIRNELIFDRDTLQFLGERLVATAEFQPPTPVGGQPADPASLDGVVLGSTAVVVRAIVDAAGVLPTD